MMLEEEVVEISELKIKNRKELHQFLERVVNKTYELEKEYQRLEEELNMVKSYIIESHKPISELKADDYEVNISKTEDSTLFVVKFKRADMRKFSTLYVDTFDERFWTIHTEEKATIVDPFIDKIAKTFKKDYVWFPTQYMERFKEKGLLRSITLQYSELIGGDEEKSIGDLSMKLRSPASGEVLELFRNLPQIKSLILQTGDQRLAHILRVCEGLSHSSPLSGIGIKYTISEDEISKFILDDIIYTGKFTARGGNSVDGHLYLLRTAKEEYATTIKYIEDEIAMGFVEVSPLRMTGHPISIILSRSVEDLNAFSNEVISCKYPFRLWGIPRYESKDFIAITGVDLHTGSKLNMELSNDWIRLYLPKGSCGNTIARFYSIIQHNYDSNAKLEGVEYGELF
ncbi:MAG TPA: hypothetical protein C5S37_09030 [Methanophagales archaeon]|nr:hypothetical protein [Methanophagales archaeon]